MPKRKCTNLKILMPEIKAMIAEGKSHREIEKYFGLTGERLIHYLLKQEHRREKKLAAGIIPKPKGRPRKRPLTSTEEYEREISRLQMENRLCGIFCSPWKGSEAKGKVCSYLPS